MYVSGLKTYLPKGEHRYKTAGSSAWDFTPEVKSVRICKGREKIAHRLEIDAGVREILWSKR